MNISNNKNIKIANIKNNASFSFKSLPNSEQTDLVAEKSFCMPVDKLGVYTCGVNFNKDIRLQQKFADIEKQNGIKIIYACEVGSKAWGSDSKDSDNDVRFIYVSPKAHYIDSANKDTIKSEFNEEYDIYGYDISKVINELKKGDYTPFEWLYSPKKYLISGSANDLTDLALSVVNVNDISKSYKKLTISNYDKLIRNNQNINIKSYLLMLKTIFMADYIDRTGKLPPLTFSELFDFGSKYYKEVCKQGLELLEIKRSNSKLCEIEHIDILDRFIVAKVDDFKSQNLTKQQLSNENSQKLDNFLNNTLNSSEFEEINKIVLSPIDKQRFELFPQDNDYRRKILSDMGLSEDDFLAIKSIVGPQEFVSTISRFNDTPEVYSTGMSTSKEKSKSSLDNVKNCLYRANLHMHTVHSDGKLSVKQLLDSAAKYADRVAQKFPDELAPFVVGITDHNTTNGCVEAIKIIKENPDKYKNLRVVLGTELSAEETSVNGFTPSKAYQIHILAQCINPFDKKLNDELELKTDKQNKCYKNVGTINEIIKMFSAQSNVIIGYAHPLEHQSFKKAPSKDKMPEIITSLINKLMDGINGKKIFVENYYQSYETDFAQCKELQDAVKEFCDKKGIISTGGLDTHGESIYFR